MRVPSEAGRRLTNTCSPRRPPAARRSARCASWCARPFRRPRSSRRWVRQRLRSGTHARRPPPPPRASTRTAGHSVVTPPAGADRVRSRRGHRSASRRYPIARRGRPDTPPTGARSGRTGAPVGPALRRHEAQRTRAACGRLERLGPADAPVATDLTALRALAARHELATVSALAARDPSMPQFIRGEHGGQPAASRSGNSCMWSKTVVAGPARRSRGVRPPA